MKKKNILGLMVLGTLMVLVGTGFTFSNQECSVASQATQVNSSSQNCTPADCVTGQACTPAELKACQSKQSSANQVSTISINQAQANCNPADCDPANCDRTDCKPGDCQKKADCNKMTTSCSSQQKGCAKANSSEAATI